MTLSVFSFYRDGSARLTARRLRAHVLMKFYRLNHSNFNRSTPRCGEELAPAELRSSPLHFDP